MVMTMQGDRSRWSGRPGLLTARRGQSPGRGCSSRPGDRHRGSRSRRSPASRPTPPRARDPSAQLRGSLDLPGRVVAGTGSGGLQGPGHACLLRRIGRMRHSGGVEGVGPGRHVQRGSSDVLRVVTDQEKHSPGDDLGFDARHRDLIEGLEPGQHVLQSGVLDVRANANLSAGRRAHWLACRARSRDRTQHRSQRIGQIAPFGCPDPLQSQPVGHHTQLGG